MVGYSYLLSVLVGFLLYSFLSQNIRASFSPLISSIPQFLVQRYRILLFHFKALYSKDIHWREDVTTFSQQSE